MKQPVKAQYGQNNTMDGLGSRELWMKSRMSHAYVHNRIKWNEGLSSLTRAFFAFVLLFGKMSVSLTFTIANELLKQQRRARFQSVLLIMSRLWAEAVKMSFPTSVRQTQCDPSCIYHLQYHTFRGNIPKVHQCFCLPFFFFQMYSVNLGQNVFCVFH